MVNTSSFRFHLECYTYLIPGIGSPEKSKTNLHSYTLVSATSTLLASFFFRCWWVLMWWRGSQMLRRPFMHVGFGFVFWVFILFIYWLFLFFFPASISALLARQALNMLQPYRKNHVTCTSLLSELTEGTTRTPSINRTITSSNGMSFDTRFIYFWLWYVLNSSRC